MTEEIIKTIINILIIVMKEAVDYGLIEVTFHFVIHVFIHAKHVLMEVGEDIVIHVDMDQKIE